MAAAETTTPASLLEAMLAFQEECPTLPKDRSVTVRTKKGDEYTYSYTPLDTIVEKTGPLLTKNGLVWSAKPSYNPAYGPSLKYKLSHAPSKEFEEDEMPLMLSEEEGQVAQAMGSAITYMRRYAYCAALNIVAEMDDDGALATGSGRSGGSRRPASEKQIKFVQKLLKEKKLTAAEIRILLTESGVKGTDNVVTDVAALTGAEASKVIDRLVNGPVKTGGSDVPSDAGDFTREPVEADPTLPFDPGVPA
jgi:ribosomal protein S28E/S33